MGLVKGSERSRNPAAPLPLFNSGPRRWHLFLFQFRLTLDQRSYGKPNVP